MVIADGLAVKACMEPVRPGMQVEPLEGAPELPAISSIQRFEDIEEIAVECLIIGGGPAGLAAAVELGNAGVRVLLVDDKDRLGGKLVLQTHKFFGSIDDVHAGTLQLARPRSAATKAHTSGAIIMTSKCPSAAKPIRMIGLNA